MAPLARRVATVTALVMVLGVAVAIPASAAGESHCVTEVVGVEADGEMITGPATCSRTLSGALAIATDGKWRVPADARPVSKGGGGVESPMGSTLMLAIHYDYYNGGGSSITIRGSTCNGSYWNTWTSWDNRISSTYNLCYRTLHYDEPYLYGSSVLLSGWYRMHNVYGFMNNRTESIKYLNY